MLGHYCGWAQKKADKSAFFNTFHEMIMVLVIQYQCVALHCQWLL